MDEPYGSGVLTLTSGLVDWGQRWDWVIEDGWYVDIVPFLSDEGVGTDKNGSLNID